jgi:preprotein translocase subunit SecF
VLTILGYSLYDTVVVFDKVRENVRDIRSSTARTYSEAANLAVNQVLVRSINTTVIGVLPVAALLFTGAFILGEGPLKDLALALFVGMVSGAYSSIFIATPLLAQMKEREPDMKKLAARVQARRAKETQKERVAATTSAPAPAVGSTSQAVSELAPTGEAQDAASSKVELEDASKAVGNGSKRVSPVEVTFKPETRAHRDGAAKRPQPQNKPRSQRKK